MMKQPLRFISTLRVTAAPALLAAALLLVSGAASRAIAAEGGMRAALLTHDLGDPKNPGNAKMVVTLPPRPAGSTASATPDDFRVYVYPAGLSREDGMDDRYLAGGVYLWRSGGKIFLDARSLPGQDDEGEASVRVVYAPGGVPAAEAMAEGRASFTSDLVDVVLAVDISLSMNYNDPKKRRVAAARTFIEMAEKGGGVGRVALATFNHHATLNTPLIPLEQGETLLNALNRIGAEGLTNLDKPLEIALRELRGSRNPVIILLTDGKNEGHKYRDAHLQAAKAGVRIFSVGLSEQADHTLLRSMADATGGIYFRAVKDSDLPEIYARLAAELGKRQLLHAEVLPTPRGEVTIPIDATVKRLVAMADGGARVGVNGPGKGMFSDQSMGSVHMGSPSPGKWDFAWDKATPKSSTLGLFGDTRLFLDVFPPQLRDDHLAVGATLAQGGRALAGAEVWVEPVPGLLPNRLRLFDDGEHGDGLANDGVYGAALRLPGSPKQFDMTVRASGKAWEEGDFVRQTAGLAIQTGEEAPGRASLGGDIDFGVLFPGETGTAVARVALDAKSPRDLDMDLQWGNGASEWSDLASRVTVEPGKRAFELEMTVPAETLPGEYTGTFSIGDGKDLGDSSIARVKVGGVRFGHDDAIDLGVVPPGTFVSRTIHFDYDADKAAPFSMTVDGGDDLSVANSVDRLRPGRGRIAMEAVVSAPMGKPDGEYQGRITLRAGPGYAEIPVRWRVKPYVAVARNIVPDPGLPRPPELSPDTSPLQQTPEFSPDLWQPGISGHSREPLDSPWEKTEKIFREPQRLPSATAAPSSYTIPSLGASKSGGSGFWSAWWVYLLAALLLLLLLLLLLAYILYRLGKSALARLLLASAAANLVLLAVFIILLGAAGSVAASQPRTISVNLVDTDALPGAVELTETEKELLASVHTAGADSAASGGGSAAVGEVSFSPSSASASGGGELVSEKSAKLPEAEQQDVRLAETASSSSVAMESRDESLRRRDRQRERERDQLEDFPERELAEMREPAPDSSQRKAENASEVGEARLDIDVAEESGRPVWSDGDRPVQPLTSEQGTLLADVSGVEKVTLDPTLKRIDPRGRRRNVKDVADVEPEPRLEMADPLRDRAEAAAPESPAAAQDDPGVEELRVEVRARGADSIGEKPGLAVAPGASNLEELSPSKMPSGVSGTVAAERAAPRGGRMTSRGSAGRGGSPMPESGGSLPGGLSRTGDDDARQGASGKGAAAGQASVGEKRFDDAPSGSSGGGADGLRDAGGGSRPAAGTADSGASPNPFGGGGGSNGDDMAAFSQPGGNGGGMPGLRGRQRRGDADGDGNVPGGLSGVPGGGVPGTAKAGGDGGEGASSGRSRGVGSGLEEGRFDDMASFGQGGESRSRGGLGGGSIGSSRIGGGGDRGGLGVIPIESEAADWQRNERRRPQRVVSVASSAVDMDSLLIVVGDFARNPDAASRNLFADLAGSLGKGLTVEERVLSPNDANLSDCLLAVLSPDEVRDWSDAAVKKTAEYLKNGGHIWMDAARPAQAKPFMDRLARAAGGEFASLDESHQLSEDEIVDALTIDGKLAAVATYQDWRKDWRRGAGGDRTMRFLKRTLNYFLSGNADSGISLEPGQVRGGVRIEPHSEVIPDLLAGGGGGRGRLWDEFGPETAASWRMPSWSDQGRISAISDGEGGRALKMDLGASAKGRAAVYRTLNPPQDFSSTRYVAFDAYYDGEGDASLSMVFTVDAGNGWVDYESRPLPLLRGWNRLRFNLDEKSYRNLSGDGETERLLPSTDRTGRAGFFLYREADSPAVSLFRDIRLHE